MAYRCGPGRFGSPAGSPKSGGGKECMCTICTCGHHRCPLPRPAPQSRAANVQSEYTSKYPKWPLPEKPQHKVDDKQCSNRLLAPTASCSSTPAPFQNETSYSSDYWDKSAYLCPPPKPPQASHHCPGKGFDAKSVYQLEYPNYGPQLCSQKIMPTNYLSWPVPRPRFGATSTYSDDYRKWQLPEKLVHKVVYNPPPLEKFGTTTYQSDYPEKHLETCPVLSRGNPRNPCGDHICY